MDDRNQAYQRWVPESLAEEFLTPSKFALFGICFLGLDAILAD
jgi:hypothetical protein